MMECGLGDIIIIMTPQGSGCHGLCRCAEGGCINMGGGGGDGGKYCSQSLSMETHLP